MVAENLLKSIFNVSENQTTDNDDYDFRAVLTSSMTENNSRNKEKETVLEEN